MRWLKRLTARHRMREAGYRRIFSKKNTGHSFFSLHWRDFVK